MKRMGNIGIKSEQHLDEAVGLVGRSLEVKGGEEENSGPCSIEIHEYEIHCRRQ